jgi:hypothetical protein
MSPANAPEELRLFVGDTATCHAAIVRRARGMGQLALSQRRQAAAIDPVNGERKCPVGELLAVLMHRPPRRTAAARHTPQKHRSGPTGNTVIVTCDVARNPTPHGHFLETVDNETVSLNGKRGAKVEQWPGDANTEGFAENQAGRSFRSMGQRPQKWTRITKQ